MAPELLPSEAKNNQTRASAVPPIYESKNNGGRRASFTHAHVQQHTNGTTTHRQENTPQQSQGRYDNGEHAHRLSPGSFHLSRKAAAVQPYRPRSHAGGSWPSLGTCRRWSVFYSRRRAPTTVSRLSFALALSRVFPGRASHVDTRTYSCVVSGTCAVACSSTSDTLLALCAAAEGPRSGMVFTAGGIPLGSPHICSRGTLRECRHQHTANRDRCQRSSSDTEQGFREV